MTHRWRRWTFKFYTVLNCKDSFRDSPDTAKHQSWADVKVFAFVRLPAPDAKPFCQSSACVPEILVCMGEWVNTVGRSVRFLVAKALNFEICKNLHLHRVFRVRVICVFRFRVFLRTLVSSPIGSTECIALDVQKTRKTWMRKMQRWRERHDTDADVKAATWMRPPSSGKHTVHCTVKYRRQFCSSCFFLSILTVTANFPRGHHFHVFSFQPFLIFRFFGKDSGHDCPDPGGLSQPVAGVIGGSLSGVSIMVANILKLFRVRFEPRRGGLEAGTLTTRPPQLLIIILSSLKYWVLLENSLYSMKTRKFSLLKIL